MELQGKNDIEKAIFLLREIDAFLSFNSQPAASELSEMRRTIQDFTAHFPHCWECGDSGVIGWLEPAACKCSMQTKLY